MPLIAPADLGTWMGRTLDDARATASIRISEGWLLAETRMDPWPTTDLGDIIPEDLRSWCLELSALCYVNNPKSMTQRQVGGVVTAWEPTEMAKRAAILSAARARYNTMNMPQGSFPCPERWPDPAYPWGGWGPANPYYL